MKRKSLIFGLIVLFIAVSTVIIANDKPAKKPVPKMPDNVKAIIDKSCFGCHNTDSKNEDAKEDLDFKELDSLSDLKKISAYKHIGDVVKKNEMPPEKILEKRPEMKLTKEEKKILIDWAKKEAETFVKSK